MKHLILIRHAETAEKVTGQSDKERELTTTGMRQAATAGHFLKNQTVSVDIIIASNATRANTTAQLIAEQLSSNHDLIVSSEELYQASVGTLFELLRDGDEYQNIAIVGHNPTLSYFAEFMTNANVGEMRPGSVIIMKFDIGSWRDLSKGSATILDRFDD